MKKIIKRLIGVLFLSVNILNAQIGINTTEPNTNAILDINSTTKGVLIPRLDLIETENLKDDIQALGMASNNLAKGMLIYNTTLRCIQMYTGTSFECLTVDSGADNSKDSWKDNEANERIELFKQSDGSSNRTTGTEFVIQDDGKVGIGTIMPSAKLEVNGKMEIGTVDAVSDDVNHKSLVWNDVTKRVEAGKNESIRKSVTVANGNSGSIFAWNDNWPIAYRLTIFSRNICGGTFYNEFVVTGSNTGSNWVLNYLGGMSRGGVPSTSYSGTGYITMNVTNPVSSCPGDGGGSNAFSYTLSVGANTGVLTIANNGNSSKTYRVVLEKKIDNY